MNLLYECQDEAHNYARHRQDVDIQDSQLEALANAAGAQDLHATVLENHFEQELDSEEDLLDLLDSSVTLPNKTAMKYREEGEALRDDLHKMNVEAEYLFPHDSRDPSEPTSAELLSTERTAKYWSDVLQQTKAQVIEERRHRPSTSSTCPKQVGPN